MNGSHGSTMLESAQNVSRPIGTNRKKRKPRYKRNPINRKLTYDRLRELLVYNPKTGKFYSRTNRGPTRVGVEVGVLQAKGYIRIMIDRTYYFAHRLAWLYVHGHHPENILDHIDRNPGNNRIDNLREISYSCNTRNCGNHTNNSSGVKGVYWFDRTGKWYAQVHVGHRKYHLGLYDDFDDAVCARLAAEQCLNWSGCDSSSPAYRYVKENIV